MIRPRQDRRLVEIALVFLNLPDAVTAAKEHIAAEFARTDGQVGAATGDGGSRSTDGTSIVERTVIARQRLLDQMLQINDDLDALLSIARSCLNTSRHTVTIRTPAAEQPRCYADPGLDGYDIPLADGGFHDPACTNYSRSAKGGLCDSCRRRLQRYRQRNELKPLDDEPVLEHDSTVIMSDLGVAHIRPLRGAA